MRRISGKTQPLTCADKISENFFLLFPLPMGMTSLSAAFFVSILTGLQNYFSDTLNKEQKVCSLENRENKKFFSQKREKR